MLDGYSKPHQEEGGIEQQILHGEGEPHTRVVLCFPIHKFVPPGLPCDYCGEEEIDRWRHRVSQIGLEQLILLNSPPKDDNAAAGKREQRAFLGQPGSFHGRLAERKEEEEGFKDRPGCVWVLHRNNCRVPLFNTTMAGVVPAAGVDSDAVHQPAFHLSVSPCTTTLTPSPSLSTAHISFRSSLLPSSSLPPLPRLISLPFLSREFCRLCTEPSEGGLSVYCTDGEGEAG